MSQKDSGYDIALIGFGNRGEHYMQRFHPEEYGADLSEYVETVHVVDPIEDRRAEALGFEHEGLDVFTYEDLGEVARPDVKNVDIAIESSNYPRRIENLRSFIETGSAVFSEKPLSREVEDAERLVEAVNNRDALSAVGLNMNQTPAYQDALQYLEENDVTVTSMYIDWFKNRGPRDHPVVEGVIGELPHQAGLIYPVMDEKPDEVSIGETDFRRSPTILDPRKYEALPEREKEKIEFCEDIDIGEGDQLTYWMLTELNTGMKWDNSDSTISNIRNSWATGEEVRILRVSGYTGEIEDDYFGNMFTIGVDFTAEGDETAFWVRKGLKNGNPRGMEGELISEKNAEEYKEDYESTDTLDLQLRKFLKSVDRGELHEDLIDFEDALEVERMVNVMNEEYREVVE